MCTAMNRPTRSGIAGSVCAGMRYAIAAGLAAVSLLTSLPSGAANQGSDLYQKRCAKCHGTNGEGKAAKAPPLRGIPQDANYVSGYIMKGESSSKSKPPHKQGMAGLNEGQAKAIANYIKTFR